MKSTVKVNDLYENKNLYMIVDNLYNLGGLVSEIIRISPEFF